MGDGTKRRQVEVEWEVDEENEENEGEMQWRKKEVWGRPGSHRIAFLKERFLRGPPKGYSLLLCVSGFTPRLALISVMTLELNHIRLATNEEEVVVRKVQNFGTPPDGG